MTRMRFNQVPANEQFKMLLENGGKNYFKFYDEEYEMRNLDGETWWANALCLDTGDFALLDGDTEVLYG